jgi:hypothetical protein
LQQEQYIIHREDTKLVATTFVQEIYHCIMHFLVLHLHKQIKNIDHLNTHSFLTYSVWRQRKAESQMIGAETVKQ